MDILSKLKRFSGRLTEYQELVDNVDDFYQDRDSILRLRADLRRIYFGQKDTIAQYSGEVLTVVGERGHNYDLFEKALGRFGLRDKERQIELLDRCKVIVERAIAKLEAEQRSCKPPDQGKAFVELYSEPETVKSCRRYVQAEGKKNWEDIENQFGIKKTTFAKKINFVSGRFTRTIIFRDVEQAYVLASSGFSKPAVILAGGVIEELLRQYLIFKNIKPRDNTLDEYIKACEGNKLLTKGISSMSDSARHFRNLVHLSKEVSKRVTIPKATAILAVASIFSIANDFE